MIWQNIGLSNNDRSHSVFAGSGWCLGIHSPLSIGLLTIVCIQTRNGVLCGSARNSSQFIAYLISRTHIEYIVFQFICKHYSTVTSCNTFPVEFHRCDIICYLGIGFGRNVHANINFCIVSHTITLVIVGNDGIRVISGHCIVINNCLNWTKCRSCYILNETVTRLDFNLAYVC